MRLGKPVAIGLRRRGVAKCTFDVGERFIVIILNNIGSPNCLVIVIDLFVAGAAQERETLPHIELSHCITGRNRFIGCVVFQAVRNLLAPNGSVLLKHIIGFFIIQRCNKRMLALEKLARIIGIQKVAHC